MRIPRLYLAPPWPIDRNVTLDDAQSHYLSRVLRLDVGRQVIVFDGQGNEANATIGESGKRSTRLSLAAACAATEKESPLVTHLAVGISRGERMDWVLQKATELGVTTISPLFTERTEVRLKGDRLDKKIAHWQQVIVSACEQCQRNRLPELQAPVNLHDFLQVPVQGLALLLHHRESLSLRQFPRPEALTLLIGPEGGLSNTEIELAIQHHQFRPVALGPRVLRTETAPIVALTAVQLLWGDI